MLATLLHDLTPVLTPILMALAGVVATAASTALYKLQKRLGVEASVAERDQLHTGLETAMQTALIDMLGTGKTLEQISVPAVVQQAKMIVQNTNPKGTAKIASGVLGDLLTSKLPGILLKMGLSATPAGLATNAIIALATPVVEKNFARTVGNLLK